MLGYPISFQDTNFEHEFVYFKSSYGDISKRYIPVGMPRLNPYFQYSVFFLYGINPESGKREGPHGTGVFIGIHDDSEIPLTPNRNNQIRHIYAVTCKHVACDGDSIIRINTKDGKSRFIPLEPHEWQYIYEGDDISAVDITDHLTEHDDFSHIPYNLFTTVEFFREYEFGIGEDGFMLGLFADQPGKDRNIAAARFGNVSLLADKDLPIEQGHEKERPSHIFDMRSRPGFSGSPVFVYRTPSSDIRNITYGPPFKFSFKSSGTLSQIPAVVGGIPYSPEDWQQHLEDVKNTFIRFFGIHSGQYHDKIKARKYKRKGEKDDHLRDGDELSMPNSMTVIVPAWEIRNLLNLPFFIKQREKRYMEREEKEKSEKNSVKPETAKESSNPSHKEDFTALVSEAAKKKQPTD